MAAKYLFDGGVSGVMFTERREFFVNPEAVVEDWASAAPFVGYLTMKGTQTVSDPLMKMFTHSRGWLKQQFQVTSTATIAGNGTESANVTIKAGTVVGNIPSSFDSSMLNVECAVYADDSGSPDPANFKGNVIITTVVDGSTVKLKRASTGDITLANDDHFLVISKTREEGSEAGDGYIDEESVVFGSTQYFELPFEMTKHMLATGTKLRGGAEMPRVVFDKAQEYMIHKENAYLFGESRVGRTGSLQDAYITGANGKPLRKTDGYFTLLRKYGATSGDNKNVHSITTATATIGDFIDLAELISDRTTTEQFAMIGGSAVVTYFNKLMLDSTNSGIQIYANEMNEQLGVKVTRIVTSHCEFHLTKSRALRGPNTGLAGIMDMETLTENELDTLPHTYKNNIKTDNDNSNVKSIYTGDSGLFMSEIYKNHMVTFV